MPDFDRNYRMNEKILRDFLAYMRSGQMEEDFACSEQERRYEMLELLEQVMEAGEVADEVATRLIFKNSALEGLLAKK